jgi:hypothetical protein
MDMPFAIAPDLIDRAVNCTPNGAAGAGIEMIASTTAR